MTELTSYNYTRRVLFLSPQFHQNPNHPSYFEFPPEPTSFERKIPRNDRHVTGTHDTEILPCVFVHLEKWKGWYLKKKIMSPKTNQWTSFWTLCAPILLNSESSVTTSPHLRTRDNSFSRLGLRSCEYRVSSRVQRDLITGSVESVKYRHPKHVSGIRKPGSKRSDLHLILYRANQ